MGHVEDDYYDDDDFEFEDEDDFDDFDDSDLETDEWFDCDVCGETEKPPHFLDLGKTTMDGRRNLVMVAGVCVSCWKTLSVPDKMRQYEKHFPKYPHLANAILDGE